MPMLPRLFIGSSAEAKPVAEAIRENLANDADVIPWTEAFALGDSFIESLLQMAQTVDFAVLVMTPDDITESRGRESLSPRDNVVFELGLFAGTLGMKRCYCVHPDASALKFPSDLLGITAASYRPDHSQGLTSAVGAACNKIRARVSEFGRRTVANQTLAAFCSRVSGSWWEYIKPVRVSSIGFLEFKSDEMAGGVRIKGLAYTAEGSRAADWWTEGCGVDLRENKVYYVWKGRYLDRPNKLFEGSGDFSFNESAGPLVRGYGVFSEMDAADMRTKKRTGRLARCSHDDTEVMRSGDKEQIADLIKRRIAGQ